jgi:hypothetical protein
MVRLSSFGQWRAARDRCRLTGAHGWAPNMPMVFET